MKTIRRQFVVLLVVGAALLAALVATIGSPAQDVNESAACYSGWGWQGQWVVFEVPCPGGGGGTIYHY